MTTAAHGGGAARRRQDPEALLHSPGACCTCSGQCGHKHNTIESGRCARTHDLIMAPRDPSITSLSAACGAELVVWCGGCRKAAVGKAAPASSKGAEAVLAEPEGLF